MSTNGFICFIAGSEFKNSYCHWDSGPGDLGLRVLHWLRSAMSESEVLKAAIMGLTAVSDDDGPPPTPEEYRRLEQYSDPMAGDPSQEWYALLNGTQGDPAAILDRGYVVDEDEPFGWVYEVNADERVFSVSYDGQNGVTWPWSALPTDQQFLEDADGVDPHY